MGSTTLLNRDITICHIKTKLFFHFKFGVVGSVSYIIFYSLNLDHQFVRNKTCETPFPVRKHENIIEVGNSKLISHSMSFVLCVVKYRWKMLTVIIRNLSCMLVSSVLKKLFWSIEIFFQDKSNISLFKYFFKNKQIFRYF